jgi:hypothetical protein
MAKALKAVVAVSVVQRLALLAVRLDLHVARFVGDTAYARECERNDYLRKKIQSELEAVKRLVPRQEIVVCESSKEDNTVPKDGSVGLCQARDCLDRAKRMLTMLHWSNHRLRHPPY